jgi:hypothetical protein
MKPHSTQDVTKCAMRILGAKYKKADLQSIVRDNYKHLSALAGNVSNMLATCRQLVKMLPI